MKQQPQQKQKPPAKVTRLNLAALDQAKKAFDSEDDSGTYSAVTP